MTLLCLKTWKREDEVIVRRDRGSIIALVKCLDIWRSGGGEGEGAAVVGAEMVVLNTLSTGLVMQRGGKRTGKICFVKAVLL